MNFINKIALCLGIVLTFHCIAMEKFLAALDDESGVMMRRHVQEEVELLESTLAELVVDQSPQEEIEAVQRNLARAQKDLEESSDFKVREHADLRERLSDNSLIHKGRQSSLVSIVDVNEGQSLEAFVGPDPGLIGVFGGTPRYSFYENYRQTLTECTAALCNQYTTNVERSKSTKPPQRLKGVERRIRKLLFDLRAQPGLRIFSEDLSTLSDADFMRLFFAAGFDSELLAKNIETLLGVVRQSNIECADTCENIYLVHVLMPSYFDDIGQIMSLHDASQKLRLFLASAALHYQRYYESIGIHPSCKVCILIPQIEYFVETIRSGVGEKAATNSTVVLKEVLERINPKTRFILFDQGRNRQTMVEHLQAGGRKVSGKTIPLTSLSGLAIHTFNPYILIPKRNKNDGEKKKHDYKTSLLFNPQLVRFFQERHDGGSHE